MCIAMSYIPHCWKVQLSFLNQINWMRDIGQSCYSQLQAAQNIKESESNEFVSAEETKKQSWEPNPKRVLMMEITDGVTTLKAMEYSFIPKLDEAFLPGLKILLSGPIECRNGILLLKNNNVTILGGEVEQLQEIYSTGNILSKCLNMPATTGTNNQQQQRSNNMSSNLDSDDFVPQNPNNINEPIDISNHIMTQTMSPVMGNVDQVPDSTSTIEHNVYVEDRDMLMSDEDDEFLQLPLPGETVQTHNVHPTFSEMSPVANDRSFAHNNIKATQSREIFNDDSDFYRHSVSSKLSNKPKLFPSLEDLRPNEQKNSHSTMQFKISANKQKEQIVSSLSKQVPCSGVLPEKPFKLDYSSDRHKPVLDESLPSSTSVNSAFKDNDNSAKTVLESVVRERTDLQQYDGDSVETLSEPVANDYPKQKTVEALVECITKIKIKSSEWQCSAFILVEGQPLSVSFSNNVLVQVFGISAHELEVLRQAMVDNDSLKKKVNKILKDGQAKLKSLSGPMTLEYSSPNCVPQIICLEAT